MAPPAAPRRHWAVSHSRASVYLLSIAPSPAYLPPSSAELENRRRPPNKTPSPHSQPPTTGSEAGVKQLAFKQAIDFVADGCQVVHPQIHDGVANVSDVVEFLQPGHDHIPHHPAGDLVFAHRLQGGLDLADQPLDIGGGDGALGAGNADAANQLFAVELLPRPILLDDQRRGKDGSLVGAEALLAREAFPAAPHAAA